MRRARRSVAPDVAATFARGAVLVPATAAGPLNARAAPTSATPIQIFTAAPPPPQGKNPRPGPPPTSSKPGVPYRRIPMGTFAGGRHDIRYKTPRRSTRAGRRIDRAGFGDGAG